MAYWEGHKSATSDALVDVLTTAITGSAKPTHSDRILFTACEFWASARNSTLLEQLRDDPISQLQSAETAFGNIGLDGVARIVARGRRMISDRAQPAALSQVARDIEDELAKTNEPVDQMIALYADQRARDRQT